MEKKTPECYGDLETVFPKGENGLRHSPKTCRSCLHKTPCLSSAMKSIDGLAVKREMVDRAYRSGMLNFLQRWSQKKALWQKRVESSKHRHKRDRS